MKTWIIVAGASSAQLFETENKGADLKKIREFDHPQSRKKTKDLTTDRPGRSFDSMGLGRHAEERGDPHFHEQTVFAQQLILFLNKARTNNEFDNLIIVAAPTFLGELRQSMSNPLKKCVTKEVNKDLAAWMGSKDLLERISSLFS